MMGRHYGSHRIHGLGNAASGSAWSPDTAAKKSIVSSTEPPPARSVYVRTPPDRPRQTRQCRATRARSACCRGTRIVQSVEVLRVLGPVHLTASEALAQDVLGCRSTRQTRRSCERDECPDDDGNPNDYAHHHREHRPPRPSAMHHHVCLLTTDCAPLVGVRHRLWL